MNVPFYVFINAVASRKMYCPFYLFSTYYGMLKLGIVKKQIHRLMSVILKLGWNED